jgi:hypothetical protein
MKQDIVWYDLTLLRSDVLLEHELLTIPEDKQEHAQSELWKCIKVTCTDTCI